jgi:predicted aspartyl protease
MLRFRHVLPGLLVSLAPLLALNPQGALESARRSLAAGHPEEAERIVRRALQSSDDAPTEALLGDILFRRADFDGASSAYRAALAADPKYARACWGLGRIELTQFRRNSARALISRAFGLDPRDPDIILSYAEFTSDLKSRSTLLRNVARLSRDSDLMRAEESLGRLEMDQRLNGSRPARLESPYKSYRIELTPFQPSQARPEGILLPVRINNGRTLHLLLDSGAHGITVAAHAARRLGLEQVAESRINGLGGGGPVSAVVTIAKSVAIGDLRLGNCIVEVMPSDLTRGADGVIGMNLFEAFEIRLDARSGKLELEPFSDRLPAFENEGANLSPWIAYDRRVTEISPPVAMAYGFQHFLMVKARVNEHEGLFLFDTGSAVTSLAKEIAPPAPQRLDFLPFLGASGAVSGAFRLSPVILRIAGKDYTEKEPVALDLSQISQRQGVRISGILGFSALRRAPVTINYRDGLVTFGDGR